MEEIIATRLASWIETHSAKALASGIAWVFNAVPPAVPMVLIFGALAIWLGVACYRSWKRGGTR